MFGELGILRLAHAFYVLRPAPAWGPVEAATLWRDLARAVAAVHASQRSRADVYFLAVPESEPEKRMLLARLQLHRPPVPYLVAHARALPDGPGRLYVLTVYGHADDPGAD